jgi:predicted Ser/Thr protein kinase
MKRKTGAKNCSVGANCKDTCISKAKSCEIKKTPQTHKEVLAAIAAIKAAEKAAKGVKAPEVKAPGAKAQEVKAPGLEVGKVLGQGAFGRVTLNADGTVTKEYTRRVTEKSIANEVKFQRLAAEAGLAPKVLGSSSGSITMELAKGQVASSFDKATRSVIATKAIEASKELHKLGFAHNDIHPGNVMYDTNTGKVQFIDFGGSSNKKADIAFERNEDQIRGIFD